MSYATVQSCTLAGIAALPVTVEVHIGGGLPGMSIVGLPQSAVRESKDRVKAAILYVGLNYPMVKIVVNLAPADLPKQGGRFDLPIALGILMATGQLPSCALNKLVVVGELGLMGQIRAVSGALPTALAFRQSEYGLLMPLANRAEASRSTQTNLYVSDDLYCLFYQLKKQKKSATKNALNQNAFCSNPANVSNPISNASNSHGKTFNAGCSNIESASDKSDKKVSFNSLLACGDMADVRGQALARRALEISAAGAHNILLVGPPGTGKSMLASRMPTIQPAMSTQESMETASIQSISHAGFNDADWGQRPFRSPHHTASGVALVGGGAKPLPGEISLAHNGVLFLDELSEFPRAVLDVLREPMETGRINISRAAKQCEFPARFQLVAAMNPCPCGYYGDADIQCRCTPDQIARYGMRVSGPFLDRIDLHVSVQRMTQGHLNDSATSESSESIRKRVSVSRDKQFLRQGALNNALGGKALIEHAALNEKSHELLNEAAEKMKLSLRAVHRVLRVARTIADLEMSDSITDMNIVEALSYRQRR